MKNKYIEYKFKKRSKKSHASQGMTAAIILIAFIITAAGIAFVILTMGQEFQLELGNVGQDGKDASSSAMQVEGGLIIGYVEDSSQITVYTFNLRLVLDTGKVDLSSGSMEMWIIVQHNDEQRLTYNSSVVTVAIAQNCDDYNTYQYGISWIDGSGDVLDPNEMARLYIGVDTDIAATANQEITIIINSGVATMKIQKTIPIGLNTGSNVL